MNIYQKINQVRQELLQQRIKAEKNGFNYKYIDLPQIEGPITEACFNAGLVNLFYFHEDKAELTIVNTEEIPEGKEREAVVIAVPVDAAMVKISDKQPIQNVGGMMTYMRRYLYMAAYAISEHDAVEEVGSEQKKNEDAKELGKKIAEKMKEEKVDKPMSEEELKERCDMIDYFVSLDPEAVEKLLKVKKVSSVDELETDYLRKIYKAKKGDNK